MEFKTLTMFSGVALLILGMGWLFKGELMMTRWRLLPNDVALLVGRRIGAIYLGMASMMFAAGNITSNDGQNAISLGALVFASLIAGIGFFEFLKRRVGPAMLVSVVIELLIAVGFITRLM